MLANAVTKSLQANSRCNLRFTTLQPCAFGNSASISASLSFFAGIAIASGRFEWLISLCGASQPPAMSQHECGIDDLQKLSLNARAKSTIVWVSFAAKIRGRRSHRDNSESFREKEDSRHSIWRRSH